MHRWLAMGIAACAVAPAQAQLSGTDLPDDFRTLPLRVSADQLEVDPERDLYIARGAVRMVQGERTLEAEWAAFHHSSGRGVASGEVVFRDGPDTLLASFAEFDSDSLQGVVFDGKLDSERNRFRLEGATVRKTGDQTYRFEEAMFTTCRCPEPGRDPWRIRAGEADLEVGGYGTARNSSFDVLDVPVIWLPWMIYPLKTERQSGFLFPSFGVSNRNGVSGGLPFFWAARRDLGVTITPQWLGRRGAKGDLELEFVYGERSHGELFGSYIHDREIDENSSQEPFHNDRWAVLGQQDLELPLGTRLQTDFRFVSDNQYPLDFSEVGTHRRDRFLESQGFLGRDFGDTGRLGIVGSAAYADDMQNPDNADRDDVVQQRLPRVDVSLLPASLRWISHLVPSFDAQYTHFRSLDDARSDYPTADAVSNGFFLDTGIDGLPDADETDAGIFTDDNFATVGGPEGDGRFQEGEPLFDRGQRVLLSPRLSLPLRLFDLLEFAPEVGWQQTLYHTDARSFAQRGLLTGRVDLGTRLSRGFGDFEHVLEPKLGYAAVSRLSQGGNPVFVPQTAVPQHRLRQLDLDNVVRDEADRVDSFQILALSLGNRLFRRDGGTSQLWADFSLSAQYDFADHEFGEILIDGRAWPVPTMTTRFNLGYDPEASRLEEALAEFNWWFEAGHSIGLSYRYLRTIPRFFEDFRAGNDRFEDFEAGFNRVNQINTNLRVALGERWALTYDIAYTFEKSLLIANRGGIEYLSRCRCWAIRVEAQDDRRGGAEFKLLYTLVGLGDERGSPFSQDNKLGDFGLLSGF